MRKLLLLAAMATMATVVLGAFGPAEARNPIRRDFFDVYPEAEGSVLDDVASSPGHMRAGPRGCREPNVARQS